MIDLLHENGVGVLHLTYSRLAFAQNGGLPTPGKIHNRIRTGFVRLARTLNLFPNKDPELKMNPYNLNQVFFIVQQAGIKDMHVKFTNHSGELGVILYFRK
jgi:hypothetical protein